MPLQTGHRKCLIVRDPAAISLNIRCEWGCARQQSKYIHKRNHAIKWLYNWNAFHFQLKPVKRRNNKINRIGFDLDRKQREHVKNSLSNRKKRHSDDALAPSTESHWANSIWIPRTSHYFRNKLRKLWLIPFTQHSLHLAKL